MRPRRASASVPPRKPPSIARSNAPPRACASDCRRRAGWRRSGRGSCAPTPSSCSRAGAWCRGVCSTLGLASSTPAGRRLPATWLRDNDVAIGPRRGRDCGDLADGRCFATGGIVTSATMRMRDRRGLGVLAAVALAALEGGCLDSLGHEEDVIEHRSSEGMAKLEDDRIEDKNPMFDASRTVKEAFKQNWNTCEIEMNKSVAVSKLDIVPFEGDESVLDKRLFHGRTDALTVIDAIGADAIPSMEVVNGTLKPFNDGLYAAVELNAEAGKRALFTALAARLATLAPAAAGGARTAFDDASVLVGAAQILAGEAQSIDAGLRSRAQMRADAFAADPMFARPIGFYSWTPELGRVFTRDRFLQNRDNGESFGALAALAFLLSQDGTLLADYQRVTGVYAGLTNPFTSYSVDALIP